MPAPCPPASWAIRSCPRAYRLDFTLDPAQDRFSGHAEIDVTVNQPGRYVWMHGLNLAVKPWSPKSAASPSPARSSRPTIPAWRW
jgi:hypothetical protein